MKDDSYISEEIQSLGFVPVCAVYSSLPPTSFTVSVVLSSSKISINEHISHNNQGLHFVSASGANLNGLRGFLKLCQVGTSWESIEISFHSIAVGMYHICMFCKLYHTDSNTIDHCCSVILLEKSFEPNICLSISVDPPVSDIVYGDSFTMYCIIFSLSDLIGRIVEAFHIGTAGNKTQLHLVELSDGRDHAHDHYYYSINISNVVESHTGEYLCRLTVPSYNITKETSLVVNTFKTREGKKR